MNDKPIIGHGRFDAYSVTNHSRSHEAVGSNAVIKAWGHDNSGTMFPSQDGHWVLKSDFDAQAERIKVLERAHIDSALLNNVADWIERGCDSMEAAKELRIYAQTAALKEKGQP